MSMLKILIGGQSAATRHASLACGCVLAVVSAATLSAHVIKGLTSPTLANAFVSSPSMGTDAPIAVTWGGHDTGLRVVCFFVANTSTPRVDDPVWPRTTGVGFELPGTLSGFSLVDPIDGNWQLVEGVDANLPGQGAVTLDFAIMARVNPTGRTPGRPMDPRGIPPGQPSGRGSGLRFCVSGPFPDTLPDLAVPGAFVSTTIERLLNGVVVGFHGVSGSSATDTDTGVWYPDGLNPRTIPLFQ